jgi:hypothetical protein
LSPFLILILATEVAFYLIGRLSTEKKELPNGKVIFTFLILILATEVAFYLIGRLSTKKGNSLRKMVKQFLILIGRLSTSKSVPRRFRRKILFLILILATESGL